MTSDYLQSARNQFEQYKLLGEKAINQLPDEKLFWKYNDESNSIANIVQHMSGNMISRWTDFLTTDGEKAWRQRDAEFEDVIKTKEVLLQKWNEGWKCFFDTYDSLTPADLDKTITIRAAPHSVMEAINRQLTHYAYHVGQMIYIGKMVRNEGWKSLSIPKRK